MKILLIGETWFVHAVHQKGFDSFTSSDYEEGGAEFVAALQSAGHEVTRIAAHEIDRDLPTTLDTLREIADVVIVSDVGANSFLLSPATFRRSTLQPDRIGLLADFVQAGGGLLMIGGYMTFSGIDGKARWGTTALAPLLPVDLLTHDDRVELPWGEHPVTAAEHSITHGLGERWPRLLGLNETTVSSRGTTLATCAGRPLLAIAEASDERTGRTAAFTSDIAPHWAPAEFLDWPGYATLFNRLVRWLGGED